MADRQPSALMKHEAQITALDTTATDTTVVVYSPSSIRATSTNSSINKRILQVHSTQQQEEHRDRSSTLTLPLPRECNVAEDNSTQENSMQFEISQDYGSHHHSPSIIRTPSLFSLMTWEMGDTHVLLTTPLSRKEKLKTNWAHNMGVTH